MNQRILALCGEREPEKNEGRYDRVVSLNLSGPKANVDLTLSSLTSHILRDVSKRGRDLLDIAAYVYALDSTVRRGGPSDVYGKRWSRNLTLRVPVRELDIWETCRHELAELLGYLTDDAFTFDFRPHVGDESQGYLDVESEAPYKAADCACLFSGGADSLAGALHLYSEGREPLLVSHCSTPLIASRQSDLRDAVASQFQDWSWPHLRLWAHRKGSPAIEHTQRSRSFLFLSLATVAAYELDIEEIVIPENGVVSLNLPKLEQAVGARASRSTQPRFVADFETLARAVFERRLSYKNPFLLKTKAEVLEVIKATGHPELLEVSVSCVHTRGSTKLAPHCGECSQCVDRRISSIAAGLEAFDPADRYNTDIFAGTLKGEGRKQFEAYSRAARRFGTLGPDDFFSEYRQVAEALPYMQGAREKGALQLFELHRRFAEQTLRVLATMIQRNALNTARGAQPPGSFVGALVDGSLEREPAAVMAERIIALLERDLPLRFNSSDPANEAELQDTIEAALASADERLRREGPAVAYSVVETVPDFSSEAPRDDLYLEAKLVKDSASRRYAVKSIGEASSYYVDEGAWALFVVYDTDRHIADDETFAAEFERKGQVIVAVVR